MDDGAVAEKTMVDFIHSNESQYHREVSQLIANDTYKVQFTVRIEFKKTVTDTEDEERKKVWTLSNPAAPYFEGFLRQGAEKLDEKIANYSALSSNWSVSRIVQVELMLHKYRHMKAVSGHSYIPTPFELENKHAIVNVANKQDNFCFLYAILSILKYAEISINRCRPNQHRQYFDEFIFSETDMPMKLCDIAKFERVNNLSVNVIKYVKPMFDWRNVASSSSLNDDDDDDDDDDEIVRQNDNFHILYRSTNIAHDVKHVNLLLLEENGNFHYTGITDLNRLMNSHTNGYNSRRTRRIWCQQCLRSFKHDGIAYEKHLPMCAALLHQPVHYELPAPGTKLAFRDWHKTISPAFTTYADFKRILKPQDEEGDCSSSILQTHLQLRLVV